MIGGQRPKSARLKLLEGNPRHESEAKLRKQAEEEVNPEPLTEIPEPPRKLKAEARKEWDRVMPGLIETSRICEENLSILATYCNLHAQVVRLEKKDEIPPASLLAQYRYLAESFGLTPQSRVRTKAIGKGQQTSPLAKFQRVK